MDLIAFIADKIPRCFEHHTDKREGTHAYLLFSNYMAARLEYFAAFEDRRIPSDDVKIYTYLTSDWHMIIAVPPCTCGIRATTFSNEILCAQYCYMCGEALGYEINFEGAKCRGVSRGVLQCVFDDIVEHIKEQENREHFYELQ